MITSGAYTGREFCGVAVHVGKAVKERFEASGLTKAAFARAIGRSYQNLYDLFQNPSWDTGLLRKSSKALNYNFFKLLAEEVEPGSTSGGVSEPAAPYGVPKERSGVDITIHIDPSDPEAQRKLLQALKAIGK